MDRNRADGNVWDIPIGGLSRVKQEKQLQGSNNQHRTRNSDQVYGERDRRLREGVTPPAPREVFSLGLQISAGFEAIVSLEDPE